MSLVFFEDLLAVACYLVKYKKMQGDLLMKAQRDRKLIKEFFELIGNPFSLRKYSNPVLVYDIFNDDVRYSVWEEDMLDRFGLENVDGWDKKENSMFCPDWMIDDGEEEDDDDFLDDEED